MNTFQAAMHSANPGYSHNMVDKTHKKETFPHEISDGILRPFMFSQSIFNQTSFQAGCHSSQLQSNNKVGSNEKLIHHPFYGDLRHDPYNAVKYHTLSCKHVRTMST